MPQCLQNEVSNDTNRGNRKKCRLEVAQNPGDGLISVTGKEKSRRSLDPPPIVEMFVDDDMDPARLYMNSPNLFCMIHLVPKDSDEPHRLPDNEPVMLGTLCSSIHRLKGSPDTTGKTSEGGYFIFGDVTVRVTGTWRLKYTLHDISFASDVDMTNGKTPRKLATTFSKTFKVVSGNKDYKGLGESTDLTKGFADQGVRLRLRKEQPKQKRKMGARDPSEDHDGADDVVDKRQRFDDFADHNEFTAGPVQPLVDTAHYAPGTLQHINDMTTFPSGPVQPSTLYANYNPIMTNNLQSRYQERVAEQYQILNGNGNGNGYSTYPL